MCTTTEERSLLTTTGVVVVTGEVDLATADHLRQTLDRAVAGPSQDVVVDVSAVTFIDCAGLRELVGARALLASGGRALVLRSPSRAVLQLLGWTGLAGAFDVVGP